MTPADVIAFFKANAGKHVLSGQFAEIGTTQAVNAMLVASSAPWPAVIGGDLWDFGGTGAPNANFVPVALAYAAAGGLVELSPSFPNPQTGGASESGGACDFTALVTPGTPVNTVWNSMLDQVAAVLQPLDAAGVPVIFRLWPENNGSWFWWGEQNASDAQFVAGWNYSFNRLTVTRGLNNLIRLNAQNAGGVALGRIAPGTTDMAGLDGYTSDPAALQADFQALVGTGLPVALSEFGSGSPNAGDPSFNMATLITALKGPLSPCAYWLNWWDGNSGGAGWGLAELQGAAAALSDPYVLNRGGFTIASSVVTPPPPPPPPPPQPLISAAAAHASMAKINALVTAAQAVVSQLQAYLTSLGSPPS